MRLVMVGQQRLVLVAVVRCRSGGQLVVVQFLNAIPTATCQEWLLMLPLVLLLLLLFHIPVEVILDHVCGAAMIGALPLRPQPLAHNKHRDDEDNDEQAENNANHLLQRERVVARH